MSDAEGTTKKSGYRLEYAGSARAKCKGAKPCLGTSIPKGALRIGSVVDIKGHTSFAWRHWGCTTPKIITNMKVVFSSPEDLDGWENLKEEDQERVRRAWEEGQVADEDIPPTARKPAEAANGEDDAEKPKKKRAPAKKKAEGEGDDGEKPKKKRMTKARKTDEAEDEAEDAEEKTKNPPAKKPRTKKPEGEDQKGATRRQTGTKKASAKKKPAKDESEASGEDFAEELAEVEQDEEDDDVDESAGKKRKRPASAKQATVKKPRATSSRAKKSKPVVEEDEDEE